MEKETVTKKRPTPIAFEAALAVFLKRLQERGLLDGEIEVVRNGQGLLHLLSDDSDFFDGSNAPQFMIGSVSKQFFAVALLKLKLAKFAVPLPSIVTDANPEPVSLKVPARSTAFSYVE